MTRQDGPPSDTGVTGLRVTLLGGFGITRAGRTLSEESWPLRKASSLVKVLVLAPQHTLHREVVCDLLWPDLDFDAAYNNLRYALHVARRTLTQEIGGDNLLILRQQQLALRPAEPLWIDADAFEAAAAAARATRDPQAYEAAITTYTGELLPDDRYEDWAAVRRETLRAIYQALLTELAALATERGDDQTAIATLQRAVALEPTDEESHARLIRLYAQGGQRSQALRQYATARAILQREIDAAPAPETERLYTDVLAGRLGPDIFPRRDAPSLSPPSHETHNLPAAMTRFIGRERERGEVARLLTEARLLTLIGSGGAGKTRLALAIAEDVVGTYPDGVWLVELAPNADPALVPQAVAAALNLREEPGRTLTSTLADALRHRRVLLVLDNCEHLTDACASLCATLLTTCPDLRILATSREALRLPGELIWRVPSLTVPDTSAASVARLLESEAVQLFVDRVRWRQPAFALTDENADAVAAICRQLDGMPLALELAAARAGVLTVPQLAARLDDALRLLNDGSRTAPPRQRTLRATLDWSYGLLEADERVMLARLAVFAGGCTLEAAETVCAGNGIARDDVLPLLAQLADKSLVQVEAERGEARYRLLEVVRQYAEEHLITSGAAEAVRQRHAEYFVTLAEPVQPTRADPVDAARLARLDIEQDNLRAALHWTRARGAHTTGLRLAAALHPFWNLRGHFDEGIAWLTEFLETTAERDSPEMLAIRANAWASAALLASQRGDIGAGAAHAEQALAAYRRVNDWRGIAQALNLLGIAAFRSNDFAGSLAYYSESLAHFREVGDPIGIATNLGNLGRTSRFMGEIARATAFFAESEALRRKIDDIPGLANVLGNWGHMAREQGDPARAAPMLAESLAHYEQIGDKRGIGIALNQLAQLAHDTGDDARARALCERSLAIRREIGDRWGIANSLCTLGEITESHDPASARVLYHESLAVYAGMDNHMGIAECLERLAHLRADASDTGEAVWAARLLGAANALRKQLGAPVFPVDRPIVETATAAARTALGDEAFTEAWNAGHAMPLTQAVTEASRPG